MAGVFDKSLETVVVPSDRKEANKRRESPVIEEMPFIQHCIYDREGMERYSHTYIDCIE